ncbi:MAG: ABC transporter ATP-binding protein [Chloroflexi bacterium]|nr:ABC transporter ATP-binding protein [Chloroflexota bacterium]
MSDLVVEARGLKKQYGATVAVQGVDVCVERGRVFGALGPNGSGKSTTVRMILGLARPDEGTVSLFGQPLRERSAELLRRVGAVVETPAFVPYLSGRDNLRLLEKYTPGAGAEGIERALHRVHLEDAAHRRFKNYSLGMKQRLGIAAAILNSPELIVLDEPTNGLDPQGTREVRDLIPELAAEGRTIVLCSHLLHEVEQVCDAVAIFQRGRVIAQGATKELIGRGSRLEVKVAEPDAAQAILDASRFGHALTRSNGSIYIDGAGNDGEEVNRLLAAEGQYAAILRPIQHSLEDVFFELTGEPQHG